MKKFLTSLFTVIFLLSTTSLVYAQDATLDAVENFEVEKEGNKSVTLKWDAVEGATAYTLLYGTNPVEEDDDEYNRPPVELENVTTHTVEDLVNGTTYYFNIFATSDDAMSETLTDEVSATPNAEGDNQDPIIEGVVTETTTQFKLVFSKDMDFPADLSSEITITKSFDQSDLNITKVTVENPTTLVIETDPQDTGSEYLVKISENFKDTNGTLVPIMERSYDFIGPSEENSSLHGAAGETGDLQIAAANVAPDSLAVELVFNKPLDLSSATASQIAIVETASPADSSLEIKEVQPHGTDPTKILVVVSTEFKPVSYTLLALRFKDTDGKFMTEENSTIEFSGASSAKTIILEVKDLKAQFLDTAAFLARLTWGLDPDVQSAIQGVKIYLSQQGSFELLGSLDPTETTFNTDALEEATSYEFKVTTVDANGEESEGETVRLVLPGTGPAGLAALFLGSLGLGQTLTTRRRND